MTRHATSLRLDSAEAEAQFYERLQRDNQTIAEAAERRITALRAIAADVEYIVETLPDGLAAPALRDTWRRYGGDLS